MYIYNTNILLIYIYILYILYYVKSFPACSFTKYKIERNYIILRRTFRITLNSFSAVKPLNSATAFTKN